MKVTKEEIVGILAAVEVWRNGRDIEDDFKEWTRWYAHITERITKISGVSASVIPPVRGGPFPTLNVSWDKKQVKLTAGEVGRRMLDGEPRIMTQASGEGTAFLIRPVAMKPGEYQIVAQRLFQVLSTPQLENAIPIGGPDQTIDGVWDVEIEYEVGAARHKLFLTVSGNQISGTHQGWAYQGDLKGHIGGDQVKFRSTLPADGNTLNYTFSGTVSGSNMTGEVQIGEYGRARWRATRHVTA